MNIRYDVASLIFVEFLKQRKAAPLVHKAHFADLKTGALWLVLCNMRAPANNKKAKQIFFLIDQ